MVRINKNHLLARIAKASWEIGCTELKDAPDFIFSPVISDYRYDKYFTYIILYMPSDRS